MLISISTRLTFAPTPAKRSPRPRTYRRAGAVKQYLVSLGISADRMTTVSFGKEKPFCTQSNETCWQQNRRGHFVRAQ